MSHSETMRFEEICEYIEAHRDERITLEHLSQLANLSPSHFQKRFKAMVGVSPKQYLEACRMNQLKELLRQNHDVTFAAFGAGFSSSSRLYEKIDRQLGMTPNQYRHGGKGLSISYAAAKLSVGYLMIGATDRGICFLQFGNSELELLEILRAEFPNADCSAMPDESMGQFMLWIQMLESYLLGETIILNLPLDIQGTAFQRKVWNYLQAIPYGETRTYTEVANGIGQPKSARAVASACAANQTAIVIPCHRVIRGDGTLAGYRWGLPLKQSLIDTETQSRNRQLPE